MAQEADDFDTFGVPEFFCEILARIDRVGPCRRLVFVIHETAHGRRGRVRVAKLVLPADVMADIVQMIVADLRVPKALSSL